MDKIFAKTLKTYLSPPSQADFFKNTGIKAFWLYDEKLYGQKKKKRKKWWSGDLVLQANA